MNQIALTTALWRNRGICRLIKCTSTSGFCWQVVKMKGGCVDSRHQSLALLYMILGQRDVSKIQTGPLTPYTIQFLRHLKDFFGVMFKIQAQESDDNDGRTGAESKVLLTCVGVGYTNINKTMV